MFCCDVSMSGGPIRRTDLQKNTLHVLCQLLCDVTADTENTASSNVACWTVFTELLPGNALIISVFITGLFKQLLISLSTSKAIPNSARILCNIFFLNKSKALFKCVNISCTVFLCSHHYSFSNFTGDVTSN
jgi:hypothetical protein